MNSKTELFDLEEEDFDTIMASDIKFKGRIKFAKPFMIRGSVEGSIESDADLVIDTDAVVNAQVRAGRVLVRGRLNGNVTGRDLVLVTSTGQVRGDIASAQVVLEQGSKFYGNCNMLEGEGA